MNGFKYNIEFKLFQPLFVVTIIKLKIIRDLKFSIILTLMDNTFHPVYSSDDLSVNNEVKSLILFFNLRHNIYHAARSSELAFYVRTFNHADGSRNTPLPT